MRKNYLVMVLALLAGYQITLCQVTYNYTGSVQTYTVPCNVDSIRIKAWGAGGGGAGADSRVNDPGGEGGYGGGGTYVNSTMAVTPGDVIKIYVAGGGAGGTGCTAGTGGGIGGFGYGTGGNGANSGPAGCSGAGGAGGGSSAVFDSTTAILFVAAAGGGGGGGGGYNAIPESGGGGGQNGNFNTSAGERLATAGSNITANGGIGGTITSDGGGGGGGGGGATNGGAGGSGPDCDCGGGGGAGGNSVGNIVINGNAAAPGDSTDAGLCAGCARGGAGAILYDNYTAPAGGNGIIIITPVIGGGAVFTAQVTPADTAVCRGSKVALHATGGTGYLWSPVMGLDSAATANPVASPDSTTTYLVTVKQGTCLDTESVLVTIIQGAYGVAGAIIPSLDTICTGSNVQLVDTGSSGLIQWQSSPDGISFSNISGASSDTFINPSNNQLTYYRVQVNGGCSVDSSPAAVVVVDPVPVVSVTANKDIFCSGDSARLCATGGFPSYQWNTGVTGSGSCIETEDAGNYYVTVTDNHNCTAESNHLPINVYPVPSVSILEKGNTFFSFGQVSYQWYLNNSPINGATNPQYIANQAGTYTVEVTDTNGCTAISTPLAITGLNSLTEDEDVFIYPNPSAGNWQLAVSDGLIGSALEVYDEQGQLVWKDEIRSTKCEITDATLSTGVYFLRISNAGSSLVRRLMKL